MGITVETRPDCVSQKDVDSLLNLGVTRVELGVQNIYDEIYAIVNRGHTVKNVVGATQILKDSAIKICYHMMPGLPGSNPVKDFKGFKKLFEDPSFKPDMLKIFQLLWLKEQSCMIGGLKVNIHL